MRTREAAREDPLIIVTTHVYTGLMADDQRLDIRIYCSRCDSYRPPTCFKPKVTACKDCRKVNQRNYIQRTHDDAVRLLGGYCMFPACKKKYDPDDRDNGLMYMRRLEGYRDWVGYPSDSQYKRDKKIVENPIEARKYILMVCKDHREPFRSPPRFEQ